MPQDTEERLRRNRDALRAKRAADPEGTRAKKRAWVEANRECVNAEKRARHAANRDHENALKRAARARRREDELAKQRAYNAARAHEPNRRIAAAMRSRVWGYLRRGKAGRSWASLVGYTVDDLHAHLESLFTDGMTWDTFGLHGWHIDHIKPVASFDLTDPEQLRACWSLSNLRPLWAVDNWRKGARIEATDAA